MSYRFLVTKKVDYFYFILFLSPVKKLKPAITHAETKETFRFKIGVAKPSVNNELKKEIPKTIKLSTSALAAAISNLRRRELSTSPFLAPLLPTCAMMSRCKIRGIIDSLSLSITT